MSFYKPTYYENKEEYEIVFSPVSSQRTFPRAPFPRKYVHCVFDGLSDVVQAVYALGAAGHNAEDIHVMSCWDYVAAVEHERQQQGSLSTLLRGLFDFLSDMLIPGPLLTCRLQQKRKGVESVVNRFNRSLRPPPTGD
jgi:hypothetical protein